jgi:hypothetical protein
LALGGGPANAEIFASAAPRRRSSADSQKPDLFLNFKKKSSKNKIQEEVRTIFWNYLKFMDIMLWKI